MRGRVTHKWGSLVDSGSDTFQGEDKELRGFVTLKWLLSSWSREVACRRISRLCGERAATEEISWKVTGGAKDVYMYTYICVPPYEFIHILTCKLWCICVCIYIYVCVFTPTWGQINKQCQAVEQYWHQTIYFTQRSRLLLGQKGWDWKQAQRSMTQIRVVPSFKSPHWQNTAGAAQRVQDNTANRINLVPTSLKGGTPCG